MRFLVTIVRREIEPVGRNRVPRFILSSQQRRRPRTPAMQANICCETEKADPKVVSAAGFLPRGAAGAIVEPVTSGENTVSRWRAIARGACPRCRRGAIFARRSFFGFPPMHARCPVCALKFEREPGYFLGAMVIGYTLAVPVMGVAVLLLWRATAWEWNRILIAAGLALLPFVPAITRWARVLWIHFDRAVDPED